MILTPPLSQTGHFLRPLPPLQRVVVYGLHPSMKGCPFLQRTYPRERPHELMNAVAKELEELPVRSNNLLSCSIVCSSSHIYLPFVCPLQSCNNLNWRQDINRPQTVNRWIRRISYLTTLGQKPTRQDWKAPLTRALHNALLHGRYSGTTTEQHIHPSI